MPRIPSVCVTIGAIAMAVAVVPAADDLLDAALSRIDQTAATFKGLTAEMKRVVHTAVINDDSVDMATITVKRSKPKDLRMLIEFKQPDVKTVLLAGNKALIYYPKTKQAQEIDLDKKARGLLEQFLLLGFGSNSRELRDAYTIKLGQPASETVAGEKTTKIELTPKLAEVQEKLKKCELWISDTKGVAVQQKVYLAAGDYQVATYTHIVINPGIGDLKLDLPKGVKIEKLN
jgi:outer membrane lipoprotein-sorting protein